MAIGGARDVVNAYKLSSWSVRIYTKRGNSTLQCSLNWFIDTFQVVKASKHMMLMPA